MLRHLAMLWMLRQQQQNIRTEKVKPTYKLVPMRHCPNRAQKRVSQLAKHSVTHSVFSH